MTGRLIIVKHFLVWVRFARWTAFSTANRPCLLRLLDRL